MSGIIAFFIGGFVVVVATAVVLPWVIRMRKPSVTFDCPKGNGLGHREEGTPVGGNEAAESAGSKSEQSTVEQWLAKPWWGYASLSFGALFLLIGATSLLSQVTGNGFAESTILGLAGSVLILAMLGCAFAGSCARVARHVGLTVPKPDLTRHLKVSGALFAFGICLQMVALSMSAQRTPDGTSRNTGGDNQSWVSQSFGDGNFFLMTPASWLPVDNQPAGKGSVTLADRANDLWLTATVVPRANVHVRSLRQLTELARARSARAGNLRISETVFSNQDGVPVADIIATGTIESVEVFYHARSFEFKDHWVELQVWSSPNQFEAHEKTLSAIILSVRATY